MDARGVAALTAIAFVVGYREETFRELLFNASPDMLAVRTADLTPLPPGVTVTGTDAAPSSNDAWPPTVTGQAGQAGLTGRVELSVGGRAAALQLVGRVG